MNNPDQQGTIMIIFALIMVYFLLYFGKLLVNLWKSILSEESLLWFSLWFSMASS